MIDHKMRYDLLVEARTILFSHWREKVFVEKSSARFEKRAPKIVNPPTTNKIMKVAGELLAFVEGTVPVVEPTDAE